MKKKLLFVVNVDWFFVSHRLPIALKAMEDGYQVDLACAVTDKLDELLALGIKVHPLTLTRSKTHVIAEIKAVYQLFNVIKSIKPDILHAVTIKPVLYANLVSRVLGVPLRVSSISGLGYLFIASGFKAQFYRACLSFVYRVALKNSKAIIFHNQSDRDMLRQMKAVQSSQEVFTNGSGVNLVNYKVVPEPDSAPVVMLVARLLEDKGVNEFVSAARVLKSERPDIRMVLVGDVDLENPRSISSEQLSTWIQESDIEYWGYTKDVAQTMSKANIIVLPSYREGLPKSLIEASACARPVITTDTAGCRDAIVPNQTGLLVPVKTFMPLVEAVIKLVDNDDLRRQFGARSRIFAQERFDINTVIDTHLKIYRQE